MSNTPHQYVLRDAKTGEVLREAHDYEVRQAFGARLNGGRPGGSYLIFADVNGHGRECYVEG